MMIAHGLHKPARAGESSVEEDYNEETGMEFEVYLPVDYEDGDQGVFVGACHEDVGLVNWYEFETFAEFWEWSGINYPED